MGRWAAGRDHSLRWDPTAWDPGLALLLLQPGEAQQFCVLPFLLCQQMPAIRVTGNCVKVLCKPCQACRSKGCLVLALRGSPLCSMNVDQGPMIGCSGRNKGEPEPSSCSRGREDPAQMPSVGWRCCIHVDTFRRKPGCSSLAENETQTHQCHPCVRPRVALDVSSE